MVLKDVDTMIKRFFQRYKKWTPTKGIRIFLLFIPILLLFLTFKIDNDFWFLINTGKTILTKGFITIEPFTIHQGLTFIPQQWLTDIIVYLLYSKFNIYGIFFLLVIINILIIFIMYKLCLLITNKKIKLSLFITIITDIILEISIFTTRPQIFDILLLLLELYLLELYIKNNNSKYLIGLPIISLLLLNLHASIWPISLVFLIPYFLGKIKSKYFEKENYKLIPLLITFIIMLLITLINPYKLELQKYFFNSYGISYINSLVGEMQAIDISRCLIVFVYIIIIYLTYYLNHDKIKLRYLLLTLGTTFLLLEHYKGILFFSITSILSLSYNLKDYFKQEKSPLKIKYLTPCIVIIIITLFSLFIVNIKLEKEEDMPLYKLANYLDKNTSKDIKLYASYNNGSYLEYRGYKTYLDPRAEVFLKKNNQKYDILLEYYNLESGILNYQDFLDKYKFDYLVIDSRELLYTYIKDTNYELVYEYQDKDIFNRGKLITYQVYKRG